MKRPILFAANSSWYLLHYRRLLIKESSKYTNTLSLAPTDASSEELNKISFFIPWRISRSNDLNPIILFLSLFKAILLMRALKPKLIHSHTLKVNLICSIASIFLDIPCVYTFAGLGRTISKKGVESLIFKNAIRLILWFSTLKRKGKLNIKKSINSVAIVCQNKGDLDYLKQIYSPKKCDYFYNLIPGSGVPQSYINRFSQNNKWLTNSKNSNNKSSFDFDNELIFLYCARLLKSKGIKIFIQLAKLLPSYKFHIFGDFDLASKDSIDSEELNQLIAESNNISYFGPKSNPLIKYIDKYSILVVPSTYGEGLPRAIAESQALKIPVISSSSAHGGNFDKDTLFISKSNDPEDYLKAFQELCEDFHNKKLPEKINKGEKYVRMNLTETLIVDKTIALYQYLLKKNINSYYLDRDKKNIQNHLAI